MKLALDFDIYQYQIYAGDQFLLKQRIIASSKEKLDLENCIIFKDKINPQLLALLRIYFLTSEDLKNNIKINSYLWDDFQNKISIENEKLVFNFIKDTLQI